MDRHERVADAVLLRLLAGADDVERCSVVEDLEDHEPLLTFHRLDALRSEIGAIGRFFLNVCGEATENLLQRDTIREAAEERNQANPRKLDIRALMLDEAAALFRVLFFGDPSPRRSAHPAALPTTHGIFVAWTELGLIKHVMNEALQTIQAVRHAVRGGRAVVREPRYPEHAQAAAHLLERLLAAPNEARTMNAKRSEGSDHA